MEYLSTILLTYANSDSSPLKILDEEERKVSDLLEEEKLLKLGCKKESDRFIANNVERLIEKVEKAKDSLLFFSYSGHADDKTFHLDGQTAHISGFSNILKDCCPNLCCVLLNGCNTYGQVKFFHQANIPIVIATHYEVGDKKATKFAVRFFKELINGATIEEAFDSAAYLMQTKTGKEYIKQCLHPRGINIKTSLNENDPNENKKMFGMSCLEGHEFKLKLGLEQLSIRCNTHQVFESNLQYHNILVVDCSHRHLPDHVDFATDLQSRLYSRKLPYSIGFFDPLHYTINSLSIHGLSIFNSLVSKANKIIFLLHTQTSRFFDCIDLFDGVLKSIQQSSKPVWNIYLEDFRHDGLERLKVNENEEKNRRFPIDKKEFYFNGNGSQKNAPDLINHLQEALESENNLIIEHFRSLDLKTQKDSILDFFASDSLPDSNLFLLDGGNESGWKILVDYIREQIRAFNTQRLPPKAEVSYKNGYSESSDLFARMSSLLSETTDFDFFENAQQNFIEVVNKKLNYQSLLWIIKDIQIESTSANAQDIPIDIKLLMDWRKIINYELQNRNRYCRLFIIFVSNKGSFRPYVEHFAGHTLHLEQSHVTPQDISRWHHQFKTKFFPITLPEELLSSDFTFRQAVNRLCKALKNQEKLEAELF